MHSREFIHSRPPARHRQTDAPKCPAQRLRDTWCRARGMRAIGARHRRHPSAGCASGATGTDGRPCASTVSTSAVRHRLATSTSRAPPVRRAIRRPGRRASSEPIPALPIDYVSRVATLSPLRQALGLRRRSAWSGRCAVGDGEIELNIRITGRYRVDLRARRRRRPGRPIDARGGAAQSGWKSATTAQARPVDFAVPVTRSSYTIGEAPIIASIPLNPCGRPARSPSSRRCTIVALRRTR